MKDSTQDKNTASAPDGAKWNPPIKHRTKRQQMSLEEMNKKLAKTKAARVKAAETNCLKIVGKPRL